MDLFRYIVRFLYKIRWYLIILPMIALVVAWFSTRDMERVYDANTTIYTGMITGYNLEGGSGTAGGQSQTQMTNLMLLITTDATIHEVSLRLFARCMMYGNANKDNNYISAEHYRQLYNAVPAEVKALINHNSENATYANLKAYERPSADNFVFGLTNYHPYFGINSITSRLKVLQLNKSDIIDIGYSANDAGIAYNTLDILNDVFARQYALLRYGETNNVIRYGGILLVICAIAFLFFVYFPNQQIKNGDKFMQQGDFAQAVQAYKMAGHKADSKLQDAKYQYGLSLMVDGDFDKAAELFTQVGDYKDAKDMLEVCNLQKEIREKLSKVERALLDGKLDEAINLIKTEEVLKTSDEAYEMVYKKAVELFESKEYKDAYKLFMSIPEYADSKNYITKLLSLF